MGMAWYRSAGPQAQTQDTAMMSRPSIWIDPQHSVDKGPNSGRMLNDAHLLCY